MKKALWFLIPVLLIVGILIAVFSGWEKTIVITQTDIEQTLNQHFPMKNTGRFTRVNVKEPLVQLQNGSERINFGLTIDIEVVKPKQAHYSGNILMSANLAYDSDKGSFYLVDAEIEQFDIDGVSAAKAALITKATTKLLYFSLDRWPVYTLKQSDVKQNLAKILLKSVEVKEGNIEVKLGL